MATKKKMLQAAAGNAGGAGLDITEVFSTYLYDGTGAAQTITNGIDLAGEGGLVWFKNRDVSSNHRLVDTERGMTSSTGGSPYLYTNSTVAEQGTGFAGAYLSTSTGFDITSGGATTDTNDLGNDYASWTFRKAPKFFDVVTYTGTGDTTTQTISHNLGAVPGCIIVKRTDSADSWRVYHRGVDVNGDGQPWTDMLTLNTTAAASDFPVWGDTAPTSTEFTVGYESSVNGSGGTYVAYLFAHNDGDGEFGPSGDQDIIKCGSYTGDGTSNGTNEVTLGFEPQWILTKRSDSVDNWHICDVMRGQTTDGITQRLRANTSAAESGNYGAVPTATGFKLYSDNSSGGTYIYMAIRRGPLAQPESGTEVFAVESSTAGSGTLPLDIIPSIGFAPDWGFVIRNIISGSRGGTLPFIGTRLLGYGKSLLTDRSNAEGTTTIYDFATSDAPLVGDAGGANDPGAENIHWLWKRAPGFCDVVAYTGDGVAGRTVSHNLGVAPEMMWMKNRNNTVGWQVYHKDTGNNSILSLNNTNAVFSPTSSWNYTNPSSTEFTVGAVGNTNASTYTYIAYLFATVPGVSKVGSFSITGSGLNIDCGFTSGARFILFKRTDSAGDWWVHDTVRGINASAIDPYLKINTADAEGTNLSLVEPLASGFTVTSALGSGDYIFYAIA